MYPCSKQHVVYKTCRQPKCPLTEEWIKKVWWVHVHVHTHTHEYYSAINKNEVRPLAANRRPPGGSAVKNLPTMQETWVQSMGWEDPPEKGMATRSSVLA